MVKEFCNKNNSFRPNIYVSVLFALSHGSAPCLPSSDPCLTSLNVLVSRPLSPVSRICSLPTVRCPQSLFLVSRPLSLVSRLCSLSPVLCTLPINCPSVPFCGYIPPFLSLAPLFPVLCSSLSCPLCPYLIFHTCDNASFS
jgi:hypothetical protein